jgi:hypothetical protein
MFSATASADGVKPASNAGLKRCVSGYTQFMIPVQGTMRTRPLLLLRRACRWGSVVFLVAAAAAALGASDPQPAKDATSYPAVDVHAKEQVAVAAEPFDTREKCKIFQVDFLKYDFLPIRIIVTNMGDRPVSLNDARIYFIDAAGDRIQAAEPDDVERRTTQKDRQGSNLPPIGPIKLHTKGKVPDSKIEADFNTFEYAALVVEPHTTRAGFLFYDMSGLGDTPLKGAKLVLREMKNADGQELWSFEIPFDKYLDAEKKPH